MRNTKFEKDFSACNLGAVGAHCSPMAPDPPQPDARGFAPTRILRARFNVDGEPVIFFRVWAMVSDPAQQEERKLFGPEAIQVARSYLRARRQADPGTPTPAHQGIPGFFRGPAEEVGSSSAGAPCVTPT